MYYAFVCDYIIFFGASTISRMNKKFGLSRIIRLFPFLWKKTSTIGTSISIPNEKKEKVYMLDFLNKLQFIAVRDNKTMESLKQCEIDSFFCFDPAIMIGELYPNLEIKNSNLNGILGLCPCVNRNMKKEVVLKKHLEFILSAITELNIESINVFLLNKKCMDDLFLSIYNAWMMRFIYYFLFVDFIFFIKLKAHLSLKDNIIFSIILFSSITILTTRFLILVFTNGGTF